MSAGKPRRVPSRRAMLGVAALALGARFGPAVAQSRDRALLLLNRPAQGEHAPFFLGLVRRLYADEGIGLEIQEGRGENLAVRTVAAGGATFAYADLGAAVRAAAAGAEVKCVGLLVQRSPIAVMGFADTGLRRPADLEGRVVALTPGDPAAAFWPAYLATSGIAEAAVRTLDVDAPERRAALVDGRAELMLGTVNDDKLAVEASTGRSLRAFLFADAGVNPGGAGIVVAADTIAMSPDLIRRFLRASTLAVEAAEKAPDEAVAAMRQVVPRAGSAETLRAGLMETLPLYRTEETRGRRPFRAGTRDIERAVELMAQRDGLDAGLVRPTDLVTLDFLPN
jgi:NitT/TauT family transport system substrate-binding protein